MTGFITLLDQPRTLDALARPTSATIAFYLTGTTTLADIYSDVGLTTPATNPVVLAAGDIFPDIFLDSEITYRRRITYGDGSIHDVDPVNSSTNFADAVYLDAFGANGTEEGDSAALKAAVAYAEANWQPIILPARRIFWDGSPLTSSKVRLMGSGAPYVNAGKTALVGGTIIEGQLILTGGYIHLENFGVDLGSAGTTADVDAIKCTATPYNSGKYLYTNNLVGLCKNSTSANHVLLFEGYNKHEGGNLTGALGFFGCVIKNQNVSLRGFYMDSNAEVGVYAKSDPLYGTAQNINLHDIFLTGGQDTGVLVQAEDAVVDNVNIAGVSGTGHERTVMVQLLDNAASEVRNVSITNVNSRLSTIADISVLSQRSGKFVDNITIENVTAIDGTAKGVETSNEPGAGTRNLKIRNFYKSYAAGTLQATMDDGIFIDGGVRSSDINGVEIVENYGTGTKIGAINYQNLTYNRANILSSHRCKVIGSGRPLQANLTQALTGTTATLQVPNNLGGFGVSITSVTLTAPATITTFTTEITGQTFPTGHILLVQNNSAHNLSITSNPAQGILNNGGAGVVLAPNDFCMYCSNGGGIWIQLKIS